MTLTFPRRIPMLKHPDKTAESSSKANAAIQDDKASAGSGMRDQIRFV